VAEKMAAEKAAAKAAALLKKQTAAATIVQTAWRASEAQWEYYYAQQNAEKARREEENELLQEDLAWGNPQFIAVPVDESPTEPDDSSDADQGEVRHPDIYKDSKWVLQNPGEDGEQVFISHDSVQVYEGDFKDLRGCPPAKIFIPQFRATNGQVVQAVEDWYQRKDDLGENEVPVLVAACQDDGELTDTMGISHSPCTVWHGFYIARDCLVPYEAPPDASLSDESDCSKDMEHMD
jgi:hypothetical protein